MKEFRIILREFIDDDTRKRSVEEIAMDMGFKNRNILNSWMRGENIPRLYNAVRLANYYGCSLDYLFGRSQDFGKPPFKDIAPFVTQLRKMLKFKQIKQVTLMNDLNLTHGHLYNWFKPNANPIMDSIIRLADYFGVSLDFLVGREN